VTATPAISRKFPSGKTIIVANYPPLTLFPEGKIATEKRNPWIIYAGLITPVRSVVEMVQAMEHVSDPRASLLLLGPVRPPELLETLKKEPRNKMFEYMMAELAIIASNFPYWEEILPQTGAGLCADPRNPVEIASKISWLLDHPEEMETMGKRGQKAVREKFH
jgi:glycosyltransferase involved in cell wall biosynthesis